MLMKETKNNKPNDKQTKREKELDLNDEELENLLRLREMQKNIEKRSLEKYQQELDNQDMQLPNDSQLLSNPSDNSIEIQEISGNDLIYPKSDRSGFEE